jgi:hypothetical protein
MKMLISVITLGGLLILSLIGNVIFFDFWNQEKEKVQELKDQVVTAAPVDHQDQETQILSVSEKFVERMFSFNPEEDQEKRRNSLESFSTDRVKVKLFGKGKKAENGEFHGSHDNLISSVKIIKSDYKKNTIDPAEVVLQIEQSIESKNMRQKAVYEVRLKLVEESGWKVNDYQVEQKI